MNTLSRRLADLASGAPDAPALWFNGEIWTRRQLNAEAQRIAAEIRDHRDARDCRVGLDLERGPRHAAAILASLSEGLGYFSLPRRERSREALIDVAGVTIVITSTGASRTGADARDRFLPPADQESQGTGNAEAYLMATSGTGGKTKLVSVGMDNIVHAIERLAERVDVGPADRYLHFAPFEFSSSVRQLLLPLLSGACVVLASEEERLDPHSLTQLLRRARISVVDCLPSVASSLVESSQLALASGGASGLEDVRLLLLASEAMPATLPERWRAVAGARCRVFNMYGATETTGIVCLREILPGSTVAENNVGHPLRGVDVTIAAEEDAVPGAPGLVRVGGKTVARGALTWHPAGAGQSAAAWDEFNGLVTPGDLGLLSPTGELILSGRKDAQVKIAGKKLDLRMVELALEDHPAVLEAACAAISDGLETFLGAQVVLAPGYIDRHRLDRTRQFDPGLLIADLNPPDTDFMFGEIFEDRVYLPAHFTLPSKPFVIDAGANIGLFALFIKSQYPGAVVHAFEPATQAADIFRLNMRLNGISGVHLFEGAVGKSSGKEEFTFYPHSTGLSTLRPDKREEGEALTAIIRRQLAMGRIPESVHDHLAEVVDAKLVASKRPVAVTDLGSHINRHHIRRIDLLKIDTQKTEEDVLLGVGPNHWDIIDRVVLETNDTDGRSDRIISLLEGYGFSCERTQAEQFVESRLHYIYAWRAATSRPPTRAERQERSVSAAVKVITSADLVAHLRAHAFVSTSTILPRVVFTEKLPRTASGKIARGALDPQQWRLPLQDGRSVQGLDGEVGRQVIAIWTELLGAEVQPTDDFFAMGGSSLTAARATAAVRDRIDPSVSIKLIFSHPVLEDYVGMLVQPRA